MPNLFYNQRTRVTGSTATLLDTPPASVGFGIGLITLSNPRAGTTVNYTLTIEDGTNSTLWREGDLLPGDTDSIDDRHSITPGQTVKLTLSASPASGSPVGAIVSYKMQV